MTEAIAFDTHRFVRRLTDGGFTVEQAETLAKEYAVLHRLHRTGPVDRTGLRASEGRGKPKPPLPKR